MLTIFAYFINKIEYAYCEENLYSKNKCIKMCMQINVFIHVKE